jgi:intein-encoded DNA endonuclease-like protein
MRIEKSYRISFHSNDKEILETIRSILSSSHPIQRRTKFDCWTLEIYSKRLYHQLLFLGGSPNKSKLIAFPEIPSAYVRDFIRGYFDGDGSVFYVRYLSSKDKIKRTELRSNFTSGSEKFLISLREILHKTLGLSFRKLGYYNNNGSIKLTYGSKDTKRLLSYMYYPNHSVGLDRKAKFVNDI